MLKVVLVSIYIAATTYAEPTRSIVERLGSWTGEALIGEESWAAEFNLHLADDPLLKKLASHAASGPDEALDITQFTFPNRAEMRARESLRTDRCVGELDLPGVRSIDAPELVRRARRALLAYVAYRYPNALSSTLKRRLRRNQSLMIKRVRAYRESSPVITKLDYVSLTGRGCALPAMNRWVWATYAAFPHWLPNWLGPSDCDPPPQRSARILH